MRIALLLLAGVIFAVGIYLAVAAVSISPQAFRSQPRVNAPGAIPRLIGPETVLVLGAAAVVGVGGGVLVARRAWRRWPAGVSVACVLVGVIELVVAAAWGGWVLSDVIGHWDYVWRWNRERILWLLAINGFLACKGILTIAAEVRSAFRQPVGPR